MTTDTVVIIDNDEEVKRLILKHGRYEACMPKTDVEGAYRHHCTWTDGEHVYCVTNYHGYESPVDNGLVALILHKSLGSEMIKTVIEGFTHHGASGPNLYDEFVTHDGIRN